MKETTSKKMSFGFGVVVSGQRNTTYAPELVALTTKGGFRLTPPVTKALGLQHGDNVMFISNEDTIDAAIREHVTELVDFCSANGLDIDTPEAAIAIHKEFDVWAIAKGIQEFNKDGSVKVTTERLSKEQREAYARQNFDAMVASVEANGDDETKAALEAAETNEDKVAILATFVRGTELPKLTGSKCANSSAMLGTGTVLTFTDSNVWGKLKNGMNREELSTKARVFSVDIENIQHTEVCNGTKNVEIPILVIGSSVDVDGGRIKNED